MGEDLRQPGTYGNEPAPDSGARGTADTNSPPHGERSAVPALVTLLDQAGVVVGELGPGFAVARDRLTGLRDRLAKGRFHLAVLGQFKRGKSTLLNALLGEEILPSAAVPVTAIPTFVMHGREGSVTIVHAGGRAQDAIPVRGPADIRSVLERNVTEASNPRNRLGIKRVEIAWPSPLLADGVVLIDTPGIGSTHRHNTESTLRFLTECDAALFVLSADPPVTEVEISFLNRVHEGVERIFFVLNKVDLLDEPERREVLAFCERVLGQETGRAREVRLHPVSARDALRARLRGDARGWSASGLDEVQEHLLSFLAREKRESLRRAVIAKATEILGETRSRLQFETKSLELPLSDLEDRLETLQRELDEAQRERTAVGDLLQGDRRRLVEVLERQASDLRRTARERLESAVDEVLTEKGPDSRAVEAMIARRIREVFNAELAATARLFGHQVTEILERHQARAGDLVARVKMSAREAFDLPSTPPGEVAPFVMERQPYWSVTHWKPSLSPIPEDALDRLVPVGLRKRRVRARAVRSVDALVLTNVEQLRWTTLQNLDLALRRFGREVDEQLAEVVSGTLGAARAVADRRRGEERVSSGEIARLRSREARLEDLTRVLDDLAGSAPARDHPHEPGSTPPGR